MEVEEDEVEIVEEVAGAGGGIFEDVNDVGEDEQEFRAALGDGAWSEVDKVGDCDSFHLSFLDSSLAQERQAGEDISRSRAGGSVASSLSVQYDRTVSEAPAARSLGTGAGGHSSDYSIELSSDEECDPAGRDVLLDRLVRPQPTAHTVEVFDILDSDEEFPVCLASGERDDNVNIEEKVGHVQEYIEIEGAGVLFSKDFGLVLFHLDNVWIDGCKLPPSESRALLPPGSTLQFYDQSFRDPAHYSLLSTEGVLHQAIVCWHGPRPPHLLKMVAGLGEECRRGLETERNSFLLYLRGEVFLRAALVKVKGRVLGYLAGTNQGIIEVRLENGEWKQVLFHPDSVMVFKKPLSHYGGARPGHLLPAGLACSVDARAVPGSVVGEVHYQAVSVLAGPWPQAPAPTLLPGGEGSYSPTYQLPPGGRHTFYYLELQLESRLNRWLAEFRRAVESEGGLPGFDWTQVSVVRGPEDRELWREQFTRQPSRRREGGPREPWGKKTVETLFKLPPPRRLKTEDDMKDSASQAATHGSRPSSPQSTLSSTPCSRPQSALSQHSCKSAASSLRSGAGSQRSWYRGSYPGAIRVKAEVKQEEGEEGPAWAGKRVKTEDI